MIRDGSHGNEISWIVTMGVGSLVLGALTMTGFGASGSGDTIVSATPSLTTVLVLIGLLGLVALQVSHMAGRRLHRTTVPASAEPARA
jgi:hypothetical protein